MANEKSILLESTSVPVATRIGKIQSLLARTAGVDEVSTKLAKGGLAESVSFVMALESGGDETRLRFLLKPDVEGVRRQRRRLKPSSNVLKQEQYERIAWGQLHEWVNVQVAMIEGGQMNPVEAFLPRMIDSGGRTLGEAFFEDKLYLKALPPAEKEDAHA